MGHCNGALRLIVMGFTLGIYPLTAAALASASGLTGAAVASLCNKQRIKAEYLITGISQGILATQVIDAQKTPRSPPVPPLICYGLTATGKSVVDTVCNYVTAHHEYDEADIESR